MVTIVPGDATTMPAPLKPINAINRPIPTPMAPFRQAGMASITICVMFVIARMKNNTPEINTAPKAVCQLSPMLPHMIKANTAPSPSPEPMAIGRFAYIPMIKVAIPVEMITAAVALTCGMPAATRNWLGTTKIKYDMAMKVVKPAIISVFTVVDLAVS